MGRRVGVSGDRDYPLTNRSEKPTVNYQGAALWYAERGLRVVPLQPNTAFLAHGGQPHDLQGTTDPRWIRSWWAYGKPQQDCGIAIVGVGAQWGIEGDQPYIARVVRAGEHVWWVPKPGSWVVAPPSSVDGDKTQMIEWRGLPGE